MEPADSPPRQAPLAFALPEPKLSTSRSLGVERDTVRAELVSQQYRAEARPGFESFDTFRKEDERVDADHGWKRSGALMPQHVCVKDPILPAYPGPGHLGAARRVFMQMSEHHRVGGPEGARVPQHPP